MRRGQRGGGFGDFLGLQLFADFGADAHQVGPRGLGVALAEGDALADLRLFGNRHAAPAGVDADDVAHQHVGAKVAAAVHAALAGAR